MANRRNEGTHILPDKEGDVALFIHKVEHSFKAGDEVIDVTAERNGWADVNGVVIEVDGSNVKVCYESGVERYKMHINLRKKDQENTSECDVHGSIEHMQSVTKKCPGCNKP